MDVNYLNKCVQNAVKDLLPLDLKDKLGNLVDELALDVDTFTQKMEDAKKELIDKVKEYSGETEQMTKSEQAIGTKLVEKEFNKGHYTQEAAKSVSFTEQKMVETKVTTEPNFRDADYTTSINYPYRSGSIDQNKNWFVNDLKEKYFEAVHSSGNLLKIDKNGNTSIHIMGALKLIVDGDFMIESRRNMDFILRGDKFSHIHGNNEKLIDKNNTEHIIGTENYTVEQDKTFTSNANFTNTVKNNWTNSADKITDTAKSGYTVDYQTAEFTGEIIDKKGNLTEHSHSDSDGATSLPR